MRFPAYMRRFIAAARNLLADTAGAIDLASIMVGVIVIGVIGGVIAATVFAVIPWSQDSAAKSSLNSVTTAEGVARVKEGVHLDSAGLSAAKYLRLSDTMSVAVGDAGQCYVGVSRSITGNLFYVTGSFSDPRPFTKTTDTGCITADQLNILVGNAGGWGASTTPVLQITSFPRGTVGTTYPSTSVAGTGSGVTYAVYSGSLPPGLGLSTTTGVVTGTPTGSGAFAVTISATNSAGTALYSYGVNVDTTANSGTSVLFSGDISAAGMFNGSYTATRFNGPEGVAYAPDGYLYVVDHNNKVIRKIASDGSSSTFGSALSVYPDDIGVDASGNLYVTANLVVLKITPTGVVTTLAGSTSGNVDGTGTAAKFAGVIGIAVASDGTAYVADGTNNNIRKISQGGVVTTVAGSSASVGASGYVDAVGTAARFKTPYDVAIAPDGSLFVADTGNFRVRKIAADGTVTSFATTTKSIHGIVVARNGTILMTDDSEVDSVDSTGVIHSVAGSSTTGNNNGTGTAAHFTTPRGIDIVGNVIYMSDNSVNHIVTITIP